ncbi:MAG TPA: phosphotransferase [Paracoccaceae bacterium]|nr:phosphotransferase [Paracoccaceae bacterium]
MTTEADQAAARWGATVTRLIDARENAVYEVALANGARAALRLHRTGYQGDTAIRAELDWTAALADRGLPVPRPLPHRDGDVLLRLPSGRFASAISWIDGAPLGRAGQPLPGTPAEQADRHRALGRLMAAVHAATDAIAMPAPWPRPDWGVEGLTGEAPFWGRFWEHPALTPPQAARLRAVRQALRDRLAALAAQGADQGPIHADVLRENVLVNGRSLSLIDFDDSGTGFRLYDLGTVLSQNLYEPAYPAIRAALVEGYAETRPADPAVVDLFTLARCCASVGWTMPRLSRDDPIHRSHIARALMCAALVLGD